MSQYQQWIQTLLSRCHLHRPDGRPLYAYRLSDDEFQSLRKLLTKCDHRKIEAMGGESHYLTCWFLYAAEWWKRSYSGGAWSWTPIFQTLNYGDLDQQMRRKWVDAASDFWGLKDEVVGGKRFLGKVVVNGGLPLKLIKEADGKLYDILHSTLGEALRTSTPLSGVQLLTQVELRNSYLPKSYRQPTVYGLLAQVISTVIALKNSLGSESTEDPVLRLDRQNPDWLNEFPLQIDSDSARQLLTKLIRQAASDKRQVKQRFSVARHLRFSDDLTEWVYECKVDASPRLSTQALSEMLKINEDELPVTLDLVVAGERNSFTIGQLHKRENEYLVRINHQNLPNAYFHQNLRLEASRFGQPLGNISLESSEAPDQEVPWIFEDAPDYPKLLWAGTRKITSTSCLILIPRAAQLTGIGCEITADIAFQDRRLVRVIGGVVEIQSDNEQYEVTCGANAQPPVESVIWSGNRVHIESNPPYVFLGRPRLELIDADGAGRFVPNNELYWRTKNHESTIDNIRSFGVGTILWRQNGKVMLRQRAVCLPPQRANDGFQRTSSVDLKFIDRSREIAQLIFYSWPFSTISCSTEDVTINAKAVSGNWEVDFAARTTPPPLTVDLHLTWSDGQSQSVCLPFPVEGAFIFDDNNLPFKHAGIISLHVINKLHVNLRGKSNQKWQIRLKLLSAKSFQQPPTQIIRCRNSANNSNTIRLYDLREQIKRLLSLCDELDARVQVNFEYGDTCKASLQVARYSHTVVKDLAKGWATINNESNELISTNVLEQMSLNTVPLLECEQTPKQLTPVCTEGIHTGNWNFDPEIKQPGLWLVYPSEESKVQPRPLLWFVPERYAKPTEALKGLRGAMLPVAREERLASIASVFAEIATDPNHPDWLFVQSMLDKFAHLPLPSLDIWVAMARVPKAVVCAFLRLEGFISKIGPRLSEELPFDWLLTSPQDWLDVIQELSKLSSGNERDLRVLKDDLEFRLQWIFERQNGLDLSVRLAKTKGLGLVNDQETNLMIRNPGVISNLWLNNLLFSEESDVAHFLRRATQNDEFEMRAPTQLKPLTTLFANTTNCKELLSQGKMIDVSEWKHSLIVAPIMVAYDVAHGNVDRWTKQIELLNALRQYRDFDRVWFDEAYKVAMACALNKGIFTV